MKRILSCIVAIIVSMSTYAQVEKYGYWNRDEFFELTPDESFIYRYVQAMDEESAKALDDLYDKLEEVGDKSIIKRNGGKVCYVKNDYPLPEGDYYESSVYLRKDSRGKSYPIVVRPEIMVWWNSGIQINVLLDYLGDKVSVELYEASYGENQLEYFLGCHVRTSNEVLEIIKAMHEFCSEDMTHYFRPLMWTVESAVINKLTGADDGSEEEGDRLIAEIDWTTQDHDYEGWDWDFVSAVNGVGLIIECAPYDNAEYWEPQVPIIANIPELKKRGHYQVKFSIVAPANGEIRLDLCSWDGSGASKALIINVEAGEKEYTIDFSDYPITCTDGMLFYQCGHLPGQHIIKKVQVYKINDSNAKETGVTAVHASQKTNNDIYNLAGQKVNTSYKGIVIQNGKKVVIRQ